MGSVPNHVPNQQVGSKRQPEPGWKVKAGPQSQPGMMAVQGFGTPQT